MTESAGSTSSKSTHSQTVWGRLTQARAPFAVWLVLAGLCPVVVAATALSTREIVQSADLGVAVRWSGEIQGLDSRWSQLRMGDVVVTINGQPPHASLPIVAGDSIRVRVQRDGNELSQVSAATEMRPVDAAVAWWRLVSGAALLLLALVAFVLRPGELNVRLLSASSYLLGLMCLSTLLLGTSPRWYYPVASALMLGATLFCGHFVCIFPRYQFGLEQQPHRALWFYALGALAIVNDNLVWLDVGGLGASPIGLLSVPLATVFTALGVGVIVAAYRRIRRGGDKQALARYRAMAIGLVIGLALPALWQSAQSLAGIPKSPYSAWYNTIPIFLFPAMATYASIRHNALAIDRFTAAVAGYALTLLLLGAAGSLTVIGFPMLVGQRLADSPFTLVVITGICFAAISPLYRRLKRALDRRFSREEVDRHQMAEVIRDLMFSIQESGGRDALTSALSATRILKCERAELWTLAEDGASFERRELVGRPPETNLTLPRRSALGAALAHGLAGGLSNLTPKPLPEGAQEDLSAVDLVVAVPVVAHGVLAGFIGLGRKRSGTGYALEDVSFLSVVGAQMGLALERSTAESRDLGKYRLEKRIGVGGMAEVFMAWQVGPSGFERRVAIKRPLPQLAEEADAAAMFLDEARIASQLLHPHIAQVHDVGEHSGTVFIAMEFVDGPSLHGIIGAMARTATVMPARIACSLLAGVLDALHYAHERTDQAGRPLHIVHRDVTPRNVLVDRMGHPKLLDFGIARAADRVHQTRTGAVRGTVPYMSPEQMRGDAIDPRSDVYSAGTVLFELLTGTRAFPQGPRQDEALELRLHRVRPAALIKVVATSLKWQPPSRFSSAADMKVALIEALDTDIASSDEIKQWLDELMAHSSGGEVPVDRHDAATA